MNKRLRMAAAALFTAGAMLLGNVSAVCAESTENAKENLHAMLKELKEEAKDVLRASESTGLYNLLIIGVDASESDWGGNSDCNLLVSINRNTKKIHLMSFVRDLGVDVPDHGRDKLNYSYANGGAKLLERTIERNFDVNIDNYAYDDFEGAAALIDELGGLRISLTDDEASQVNVFVDKMCASMDLEAPDPLEWGDTWLLSGIQVVAYARIRTKGYGDAERSDRQREILMAAFDRVKEMTFEEQSAFAAKALELVHHDLDAVRIVSLAAQLPELLTYEVVTTRVPFDGCYWGEDGMLIAEQPYTNERIREILNDE